MGRKRPHIEDWTSIPVRGAFKYLTKYKRHYILRNPDGSIVSLADAIRNYQKDLDPKWPLHVMMSNLGYIANGIARAVSRFGLDAESYISEAFLGICKAMLKCDPDRAKMSYIGSGVFFAVTQAAYKDSREKEWTIDIQLEDLEGEPLDDDHLAAAFGLYEVHFADESEIDDEIYAYLQRRNSSGRT
jgi:hypothetical protein